MHACTTYFHQGSDLCEDLEVFFKQLAEEVSKMENFIEKEKSFFFQYRFVRCVRILIKLKRIWRTAIQL